MSNTSEESAVEDKRNSKNSVNSKKTNLTGFQEGFIKNLILTYFIALIGASFIYFTSLRTDALDFLFPSNLPEYFSYAKVPSQVGGKCSFADRKPLSSRFFENEDNLKDIGIPPSQSWLYAMNNGGDVDFSLQGFKNWFTLVNADVYSVLRSILKGVLQFFNKKNMFSSDLVKILFITFIVILIYGFFPISLLLLCACIFITSCLRAWNSSSILFFLVTVFFGPAFFLSAGIAVILLAHFLLTILFIPSYIDSLGVESIMRCNLLLFGTMFMLFTTWSGFKHNLPSGVNAGFAITTIFLFLLHKFNPFTKSPVSK